MSQTDVLIVGGGLIGLGIAWELSTSGAAVTLIDRDPPGARPTGASWAAAGMLAPYAEAGFEDEARIALGRGSLELYPEWTAKLEAAAGMSIDYRTEGTLIVALDRDDVGWLERIALRQESLGVAPRWLEGAEAREREPHLSPTVTAAIDAREDLQVDNRLMWQALRRAFPAAGGTLVEGMEATRIARRHGRVIGAWARPAGDGEAEEQLFAASRTVVCAGAWSRLLLSRDLVPEVVPPIRPVKGQMLSLEMSRLFHMDHVVRTRRVYLAPKGDGRLVVGATSEERGFDGRITAGGMLDLLRDAWETAPGIHDLAVRETWTGFRPATRDHAPVIGATAMEGLYIAAGHHRNGVLLTPITARAMREILTENVIPALVQPFGPGRFHPSPAPV